MSDILDRLRDRDAIVATGLFHAIPVMRQAADEIERLRKIEAVARELIGPEGMRLTVSDTQRLTVIEKADKSDPHYRLCTLLES